MEVLLICVTVLASVAALRTALWRGADNPTWELRWRALDPGYRDWLAAMTTSPAWLKTLTDPEEIELAKGFGRRERRRRAYFDLAVTALLIVSVAFALAGLLPSSTWGLILGCYTLLLTAGSHIRDQRIKRKVRIGSDAAVAPAPLDASATS